MDIEPHTIERKNIAMKSRNFKDVIYEKTHHPSGKTKYDVQMFLVSRRKTWEKTLLRFWRRHRALKFDVRLEVTLQKREKEDKYILCTPCFLSGAHIVLSEPEVGERLDAVINKVLDSYDVYMKQGSGWILQQVKHSQQNVYRYTTLGGGGVRKRVQPMRAVMLPNFLVNKTHSLLTFPPTPDKKCFLHCILAALHPYKGLTHKRVDPQTYLQYEQKLKTDSLTYPVELSQIPNFERDNGLCINVVGIDVETSAHYYLYRGCNLSERSSIDLLLYKDHYSLITSWSCFMGNQKNRHVPCSECGRFFRTVDEQTRCTHCRSTLTGSRLVFPDRGTKQEFRNYKNVSMNPFVYYCDLETIVTPVEDEGVSE